MKLFIFKDTEDFLNQMELLSVEYTTINHYYKFISTQQDLTHQLHYLDKVRVLSFNGFRSDKIIKITVEDANNVKFCINYKFKNTYYLYNKMIHFLRRKDLMWLSAWIMVWFLIHFLQMVLVWWSIPNILSISMHKLCF